MDLTGAYVKPDGWTMGNTLSPGDDFSPYRLLVNSNGPIKSLAVRVDITGHRMRHTAAVGLAYRCRITFVGDGEPDVVTGGWISSNAVTL